MESGLIEIDGSFGEGGGQIVRTACSLAAVTGKACRIFNIRYSRRQPGLRPQHVAGVRALAQLCDAGIEGDQVDSRELLFRPGQIRAHHLMVNVETAGSITLMLQALLPAIVASGKPATIEFEGGGTDTSHAPTFDYFEQVFLWFLRRAGIAAEISVGRRGYYPKGGAAAGFRVASAKLGSIHLIDRGRLERVTLISRASEILARRRVAERQIEGALGVLEGLHVPARSHFEYHFSFSPGSSICVIAEFANTVIGASALGAPGKMAEDVGREAAGDLARQLRDSACLDRYMADQILPYLALGGRGSGATVAEITSHCWTNMGVIERFLDGLFEVADRTIMWAGEAPRPGVT